MTSRIPPTVCERARKQQRRTDDDNPNLDPKLLFSTPSLELPARMEMNRIGEVTENFLHDLSTSRSTLVTQTEELGTSAAAIWSDPYLGGPSDRSLLTCFKNHVAFQIWNNPERQVLKLHNHASAVLVGSEAKKDSVWDLEKECHGVQERVRRTGLAYIAKYSYPKLDRVLLTAFTERWYEDTNTFHMPFGEMTITLEDVHRICGLPIEGRPIVEHEMKDEDEKEDVHEDRDDDALLVSKTLDIAYNDVKAHMGKSKYVQLKWLREQCCGSHDSDSDRVKDACARGYLLYLFGCTLFVDKSASKVSVFYLHYLKNLDEIPSFSWGTAVLAYLYRQLGFASMGGNQLAGYLTLFQAWIDDHFNLGLSVPNPSYVPTTNIPRMYKWEEHIMKSNRQCALESLREQLDGLTERDVIWDPYRPLLSDDVFPLPEYSFYTGCILVNEIAEAYNPDRVLRQLGLVQTIPKDPIRPQVSKNGEVKNFGLATFYWRHWEDHLMYVDDRSREVSLAQWEATSNYLDWFKKVSHPLVQNPDRCKSNQPNQSVGSVAYYRDGIDRALASLDASDLALTREILIKARAELPLPDCPHSSSSDPVVERSARKATVKKTRGTQKQ